MQTLPRSSSNPFALMLDPDAIFAQLERSQRLECLERRICRPLDKPLLNGAEDSADGDSEAAQNTSASGDNRPGRAS